MLDGGKEIDGASEKTDSAYIQFRCRSWRYGFSLAFLNPSAIPACFPNLCSAERCRQDRIRYAQSDRQTECGHQNALKTDQSPFLPVLAKRILRLSQRWLPKSNFGKGHCLRLKRWRRSAALCRMLRSELSSNGKLKPAIVGLTRCAPLMAPFSETRWARKCDHFRAWRTYFDWCDFIL